MKLGQFWEKALRAFNSRKARQERAARQVVNKKHPALVGIPLRFFLRPMDKNARCFQIDTIEANAKEDCLDIFLKPQYIAGQLPARCRRPY